MSSRGVANQEKRALRESLLQAYHRREDVSHFATRFLNSQIVLVREGTGAHM